MPLAIPTHKPPTPPGEMLLEEFLKPLNVTLSDFAHRLGLPRARLSEVIHGRRRVTPDTALRLERALGMEAQFWLNLQLMTDLYEARAAADQAALRRIRPLLTT